jgi:type I restriction enzyme R subunit
VRKAVAEFSINPVEIENQISLEILPLLFADLGVDKAQILVDEIVQITRLGLAGHH